MCCKLWHSPHIKTLNKEGTITYLFLWMKYEELEADLLTVVLVFQFKILE